MVGRVDGRRCWWHRPHRGPCTLATHLPCEQTAHLPSASKVSGAPHKLDTQPCRPPLLRPLIPQCLGCTDPATPTSQFPRSPVACSTKTRCPGTTFTQEPPTQRLQHVRAAAQAGHGAGAVLGDVRARGGRHDRRARADVHAADAVAAGAHNVHHCVNAGAPAGRQVTGWGECVCADGGWPQCHHRTQKHATLLGAVQTHAALLVDDPFVQQAPAFVPMPRPVAAPAQPPCTTSPPCCCSLPHLAGPP